MKGLCYIVLIIGFFLFYQQNPVYAIIIIVLFIGVSFFFKSRKSNSGTGIFGFLSGKQSQQENLIDDLITLMMIQQLFTSDNSKERVQEDDTQIQTKVYLDRVKKEIEELLGEN